MNASILPFTLYTSFSFTICKYITYIKLLITQSCTTWTLILVHFLVYGLLATISDWIL